MNDRFNFRFGVTISHYDENDEDIETTIICKTEAIFGDGAVGVCKETLENVITSLHLSKERERTLWNALYEYERIEDWFVLDQDFIEQCTGLKDKNGKLIYEGDIMEHRIYLGNPELYVVKWSESVNGWVYQEAKNSLKTSYILTEFTDSIIGNIHENPELLKESK